MKTTKKGAIQIVSYLKEKVTEFETGRKYWESKYNNSNIEDVKKEAHRNVMHFMSTINELQSMILQLTLDYKL